MDMNRFVPVCGHFWLGVVRCWGRFWAPNRRLSAGFVKVLGALLVQPTGSHPESFILGYVIVLPVPGPGFRGRLKGVPFATLAGRLCGPYARSVSGLKGVISKVISRLSRLSDY